MGRSARAALRLDVVDTRNLLERDYYDPLEDVYGFPAEGQIKLIEGHIHYSKARGLTPLGNRLQSAIR